MMRMTQPLDQPVIRIIEAHAKTSCSPSSCRDVGQTQIGHDEEHVARVLQVSHDGFAGALDDADDAAVGPAVVAARAGDEAGDDFVAMQRHAGVLGGDEQGRARGTTGFHEGNDECAAVLSEGYPAGDEVGLGGLAKLVALDAHDAAGREEKAELRRRGARRSFLLRCSACARLGFAGRQVAGERAGGQGGVRGETWQ